MSDTQTNGSGGMEALIGEYEISYTAEPPLLLIHHLPRGRDVVQLAGDDAATFRALLATEGKRIRALGSYQVIFGGSDDLSFYLVASGQRSCYLNAIQVAQFRRLMQAL